MGGLGPTELFIILAILLLIFAGTRLPPLAEALQRFREEWQRPSPYERQFRREAPAPQPWLQVAMLMLSVVGLLTLSWLMDIEVLNVKEAAAVALVVAVWLLASHYCLGRRRN